MKIKALFPTFVLLAAQVSQQPLATQDLTNAFTRTKNFDAGFQVKAPDSYNDICRYGALCGATASSTSATTTSSSTYVTVASAGSFQNGQYVTIYNAGAAPSITSLGTITLTPALNAGGFDVVAANAGSTSYSYKVVAADKFGGYLAATAAVSTTTGNVLGMHSVNITSMSRAGLTVTVTTAAPHRFVVGAEVYIKYNSSNTDHSFNGFFIVTAAPDNTHFSFLQGFDTKLGASTSDTGGVAIGFVTNSLAWTPVAGAFRYYIYGRTKGSYAIMGQTLDHFWIDYGSPMNDNQSFPAYIPTAAPSSGANDHLTARIISGGGSTRLVLSAAAGANTSRHTIVSDDGPAIKAACGASQACYIPTSGARINSYTALPGSVHFWMGGSIALADTLEFSSASAIDCARGASTMAFAWIGCGAAFNGTTAYPVISLAGNSVSFTHMSLASGAQNGALLMADYADNGLGGPVTNISIDYSTMATGTSATDYLGQHMIWQSDGFSFRFDKDTFLTGSPGTNATTSVGNSPVPTIVFKNQLDTSCCPTANFAFTRDWFVGRTSVDQDYVSNSAGINYMIFHDIQTQNSFLPQAMLTGLGTQGLGGNVDIENVVPADFPTAFFANFSVPGGGGLMRIQQVTQLQGSYANTTGQQMINVMSYDVANLGQNGNVFRGANSFSNLPVSVMGSGSIGFAMPSPAAPAVSISGASGPAANTYYYATAAIDTGGRSSPPGPLSSPITANGSQGVLVTFGSPAPGQVANTVCRARDAAGVSLVCATSNGVGVTGMTFLDNGSFFPALSPNQQASGGASSVINSTGIATPNFKLVGTGVATTITPNATVARTQSTPDASGQLAIVIFGSLTTTSATTDNVILTGMTSTGHCSLTATNTTAASNIATTFVSAKSTNQITVTHTTTSGMTYDIACAPY